MAHKYDGQWRSFILPKGEGAKADGKISLRVNDAGQIETGSNHDGKPVTGPAITGDNLKVIQEEPGNTRTYEGTLFSEAETNRQKSIVIIGHYTDRSPGPVPHPAPPPKDEGVWVVTKP